jgi:hypothetical protein
MMIFSSKGKETSQASKGKADQASMGIEADHSSKSFKSTQGHGSVHLKCEGETGYAPGTCLSATQVSLRFNIAIGSLGERRQAKGVGSVEHSFAQSACCSLPRKDRVWDFEKVLDQHSMTFDVFLDILPLLAGSSEAK